MLSAIAEIFMSIAAIFTLLLGCTVFTQRGGDKNSIAGAILYATGLIALTLLIKF